MKDVTRPGGPDLEAFADDMWTHYRQWGRHDLPWRCPEANGQFDPYKILASELMLQQTQVGRVIPKYEAFLARFPDVTTLAGATLADVLVAWSGLGYNRRAKYLWQAAQQIVEHGSFPQTMEGLVTLPGVGRNTAGAVLAYAFNQPAVFLETNIRTVYIHYFYHDKADVHDRELLPLVAATVPPDRAREFYWALMDYGTHLKQTVGNIARASRHYRPQSRFEGSRRQVRGKIIRLLASGPRDTDELIADLHDPRAPGILTEMVSEGLVATSGRTSHLA
jgi:A/G-specific adenine glycosylase